MNGALLRHTWRLQRLKLALDARTPAPGGAARKAAG